MIYMECAPVKGGPLVAAAHGRAPAWASGIYGAELWSLLQAATVLDQFCAMRTDCESARRGVRQGSTWAAASSRRLARAWIPLAVAVDDDAARITWMPAHSAKKFAGGRPLANGTAIAAADIAGNGAEDTLAKAAAEAYEANPKVLAAMFNLLVELFVALMCRPSRMLPVKTLL